MNTQQIFSLVAATASSYSPYRGMGALGMAINVGLCFLGGSIAAKKGRSFIGYSFLGLCLTPIVGIIVAACVSDLTNKTEQSSSTSLQSPKGTFTEIKNEHKIGKCDLCNKENVTLHYVKIVDDAIPKFRFVCGDCFGKHQCALVDPADRPAEEQTTPTTSIFDQLH